MQTMKMNGMSLAVFNRKVMDIVHSLAMMEDVSYHTMYYLSNFYDIDPSSVEEITFCLERASRTSLMEAICMELGCYIRGYEENGGM
jgi:hypothetical protein